ncbi:MAG: TetR/AcrR family transcriptional regulator [Thermodesulfobacteriota bacterium]|nr:TetR/AcrR family transcriptional regulator [Thermodesulfobacteriota bacterium]
MNQRETAKSETHQLILGTAKKLFREKGVEQCTMRSIAKEAGVSAASVIVHFKNKTALLEEALYEDIERTISQAVATMPAEGSLTERLMHLAKTMFVFYGIHKELYRILIRDTVFEPEENSPHLTRQLEHYLQFFGELIKQEKRIGNIRPDADAHIAAESLFALYFKGLMDFLRNPAITVETALEKLSAIANQHLTGIMIVKEKK